MVFTVGVAGHLGGQSRPELETKRSGKVEDADAGVGQLDGHGLELRQLIVHQPLAVALHCLADFAVNEAQLLGDQGLAEARADAAVLTKVFTCEVVMPPTSVARSVVAFTDEKIDAERSAVKVLLDKRVDGLIVSPSSGMVADHLLDVLAMPRPLVLFDRALPGLDCDWVTSESPPPPPS